MAISDLKLRTIYGKPYSGPQEVADADGLSVRISPKGSSSSSTAIAGMASLIDLGLVDTHPCL